MQIEYDDFIDYVTEFDSEGKSIYLISAMLHSGIKDVERLHETFVLINWLTYTLLKEEDYQIYILKSK